MNNKTIIVTEEGLGNLINFLGEVIGHVIYLSQDEGLEYLSDAAKLVSDLKVLDE